MNYLKVGTKKDHIQIEIQSNKSRKKPTTALENKWILIRLPSGAIWMPFTTDSVTKFSNNEFWE